LVERSKDRPPYVVHKRIGDFPGSTTSTVHSLANKQRIDRARAS